MSPVLRVVLRILGIGALVAGGLVVALAALIAVILVGPLIFWVAWNVLDFASAVGLPELGFWGIVLATLFLVVSWFGKVVIAAVVFLVDPSWFHGAAEVRWPEATFHPVTHGRGITHRLRGRGFRATDWTTRADHC